MEVPTSVSNCLVYATILACYALFVVNFGPMLLPIWMEVLMILLFMASPLLSLFLLPVYIIIIFCKLMISLFNSWKDRDRGRDVPVRDVPVFADPMVVFLISAVVTAALVRRRVRTGFW